MSTFICKNCGRYHSSVPKGNKCSGCGNPLSVDPQSIQHPATQLSARFVCTVCLRRFSLIKEKDTQLKCPICGCDGILPVSPLARVDAIGNVVTRKKVKAARFLHKSMRQQQHLESVISQWDALLNSLDTDQLKCEASKKAMQSVLKDVCDRQATEAMVRI